MTRVAVVGNCQAIALGHTLRWLCPDAEVEDHNWGLLRTQDEADALAERLRGHDVVITQYTSQESYGGLATERLEPQVRRLVLYPKVAFTGFHPDLIRLKDVLSPLRDRHSSLIAAAFVLGLPPARTEELFNAYVYAVAGFFDEFAKAEAYLVKQSAYTATPLAGELPAWKARGVFVHIPNHPLNWAMLSMARALAGQVGLAMREDEGLPSDLFAGSAIWPVYPEIARRLGAPGSLSFKPPGPGAVPIELDEMIERSLKAYGEADPEVVRAPRVLELAEILRREGV
jgi:hypothetical protein